MNLRPHTNGNTPDDFRDAALALHHAAQGLLDDHIREVALLIHPRNYQHLPAVEVSDAIQKDSERLFETLRALRQIKKFAADVMGVAAAE